MYPWFDGEGIFRDKETGRTVMATPSGEHWILNIPYDDLPTWYSLAGHPVLEEFEFLKRFEPTTERAKNLIKNFFLDRARFYERVAASLPPGTEYIVHYQTC